LNLDRYSDPDQAHIFIAFEVSNGKAEVAEVISKLEADHKNSGPTSTEDGKEIRMRAMDISDNEMAKTHGRYLFGGRAPTVKNERLFRFQFPERPGALKRFLSLLESDWNVSLFHYRNHGSDIGRVLVGMQVINEETSRFDEFLTKLGYPYVEETLNPVYQDFLK
jgi:threonine dehydratase